jgi:hypothetical protein
MNLSPWQHFKDGSPNILSQAFCDFKEVLYSTLIHLTPLSRRIRPVETFVKPVRHYNRLPRSCLLIAKYNLEITINVHVVYLARDIMILMQATVLRIQIRCLSDPWIQDG